MYISRLLGLGLLTAALLLTGCTDELKAENELLLEENEGLRSQLALRGEALEAAERVRREREMEAARLRRELEESRQAVPVAASSQTGFEGIEGVSGSRGVGEVTATVASDLLFDSGKATVKAAAKASLDSVASVLNSQYAGKTIRVVGHTDTDPIRRSGHKSNYHLGFERAYAVRDYLISRGVSSDRIYLASHGPNRPAGSKAQSRRVEIVVVTNE